MQAADVRACAGAAGLLLLLAPRAESQGTPRESRCDRVGRAAAKATAAERRGLEHLRELQGCPAQAVPHRLAAWEALPNDHTSLQMLLSVTRRVRDGRLLTAMRRIARDRSGSTTARTAAMAGLHGYLNPENYPVVYRSKASGELHAYVTGGAHAGSGRPGPVPVPAGHQSIASELRAIAAERPIGPVQQAALSAPECHRLDGTR